MRRAEQGGKGRVSPCPGGSLEAKETHEYYPAVMLPTVRPSCIKIYIPHSYANPTPPECLYITRGLTSSTQLNHHCGHC